MNNRPISLYMNKTFVTAKKDDTLNQVFSKLHKHHSSHLIVVDNNDMICGIISQIDLSNKYKKMLQKTTGSTLSKIMMNTTSASEIMTPNPICLKASDHLDYAVELLLQDQFHCLPVVENKKPIGIIKMSEIVNAYYQEVG